MIFKAGNNMKGILQKSEWMDEWTYGENTDMSYTYVKIMAAEYNSSTATFRRLSGGKL